MYLDQNATVFVFRGSVYWTVSAGGDVIGPIPLRQHWPDLPPAIEAVAFSPLDFKWYFFKGTELSNVIPLKEILQPTASFHVSVKDSQNRKTED